MNHSIFFQVCNKCREKKEELKSGKKARKERNKKVHRIAYFLLKWPDEMKDVMHKYTLHIYVHICIRLPTDL